MVNTNFRFLAFALLLLLFVGAVSASPLTDLNESAVSLRSANYAGSLKIVDHLLFMMVQGVGADNDLLGTALTHKALASAGLGKTDDALWYWYIAQEISPAAGKTDLSSFGAAGEFLKRHPFSNADTTPGGKVTPARVVKQVLPKFPPGASRFGIGGDLVVQIIIDKNGQPTLPRIIRALPAPTLSFVALAALKHWQFEPARRNGEAVPMSFDLTVHYKL